VTRLRSIAAVLALTAPLLAATAAAPTRGGAWLVSGRTLPGFRPVAAAPDGHVAKVTLRGPDGATEEIALADLIQVDYGKLAGAPVEPSLRLRNGDRIYGRVSFPQARRVRVAAGWGVVTAPISAIEAVRIAAAGALPPPGKQDAVWLANGDRVEGEITGIANGKITVDLGGAPVPIALHRVTAFTFGRREPPPAPVGVRVRLDLGGGERISGRWLRMDADTLTLATSWGGEVPVPLGSISRLEVQNGRLVYLSDLRPVEAVQTPYLDGAFPHRRDRSLGGRPLRLGARTYRRGLGVHSYSSLTYSLGGGFETFKATVGVDNEVGDQGSVIFRVFGDGKLLAETPVLRGSDAPRPLEVAVKGVLLLRLEVDYADAGDAADHADWADARLLR